MPTRRSRRTAALPIAVQAAELAVAVPQVVAHRLARMALAGPTPSPRDRKEFARMVAEKNAAFAASWSAMGLQAARAHQALAASWLASFSAAAWTGRAPVLSPAQLQRAALGVLGHGLAPVHHAAVANARRLGRTRK